MPTVEQFLIERLKNVGVQHVFGVPGEHIGGFFQKVNSSSGISVVTTADESGAAHAADSYARIKGAGCVAVTYNVGAFKIVNAVAAANAERSPLVIVAGAPAIKDVSDGSVYEHMRRTFECQRAVFENLCCATTVLDDPVTAGYEIDRVLEALRFYKQPVYIELPKDVGDKNVSYDVYRMGTPESPKSDPENLSEALDEVVEWVNNSSDPVILAGVEVARYELGSLLQKFSEKTNIPIATTLLSKSVINEKHPLYLGLYNGTLSQPGVQDAVEQSDCVLMFGVMAGDAALSYMPIDLRRKNVVSATVEQLKIKNHAYKRVQFLDFIQAFSKAKVHQREKPKIYLSKEKPVFVADPEKRITSARLFEKLNSILDANSLIISDTGDSMFGSSQLTVHHSHSFLGHALYSSVGSAIPATVGANLARPTSRPLVILGDRAFQASCNDLGTIVAQGLKPTIIIMNNHGNGAERSATAQKVTKMPEWNYDKITEMVGGIGAEVKTEGELEAAINVAWKSDKMSVINVNLDADDHTPVLQAILDASKKV